MTPSSRALRRVLILAYYFPPMGLSGVQRTLKFAKYLPDFGWEPVVLSCEPGGYFAYDESLLKEVDREGIAVHRTSSWDPNRLFGRRREVRLPSERTRRAVAFISQLFFIPDNKVGWWLPARKKALELHTQHPFDAVFSTAPPYTAHLIAAGVARSSRLPLILDFRDDWIGNPRHSYPTPLHRRLSAALEKRALRSARRIVVINDVIGRNLAERNRRDLSPEDVVVIPQGYDRADFVDAGDMTTIRSDPESFTLLYSGVFYDAQTPEPFLRGLADLVERRPDLKQKIVAKFVGLVPRSASRLAKELSIETMIRHVGYVDHREAVAHLASADVLWMMIGRTEGSESISTSKLYEYFGTEKPILGIVPEGAARTELVRYGAAAIADPDVVPEVSAALEKLYDSWSRSALPSPDSDFVRQFDRRRLTRKLGRVFDAAVGTRSTAVEQHPHANE